MKEDYPYSVLEEKVNSFNVDIIGVEHTPTFFREYESFFEEKISQADAIIIEDVAGGDFWQDGFFRGIGEIASSQQKRIYQTDTYNSLPVSVDLMQASAGIALGCLGCLGFLKGMDILSSIGNLSLGVYLFSGSLDGRILKGGISGYDYGLDNLLLYGYQDYREIVIAGGIDKLCHEDNGIKKFVCIHGAGHSKPIRKYLKNPGLRKIKRIAYLPYEIISFPRIKEYIHTGNGWEQK